MILVLLQLLFIPAAVPQVPPDACKYILDTMDCSMFEKDPICGSNNVQYPNHCAFAQAHCRNPSTHIQYQGECVPTTAPSVTTDLLCEVFLNATCVTDHELVCGSNNITYQNLCIYHKEHCRNPGLSIQYKGMCGTSITSATTLSTTTASPIHRASTTHEPTTSQGNVTVMTTIDYCEGMLQTKCPYKVEEVCGTDGKRYRNRCEYQKAKCNNPSLNEDLSGGCPTAMSTTVNKICEALVISACHSKTEICGNDGNIYKNECEFRRRQCLDSYLERDPNWGCSVSTTVGTSIDLTVTLDFMCQAIVAALCGDEVEESCGSDGKTYRNQCEFQKGNCYNPALVEVSKGACKTTTSTATATATATATTATTTTTTVSATSARATPTLAASTATTTTASTATGTTRRVPTGTMDPLCQALVQVSCDGQEMHEICGTDGKVYMNGCEFQKENCYNPLLRELSCPSTPVIQPTTTITTKRTTLATPTATVSTTLTPASSSPLPTTTSTTTGSTTTSTVTMDLLCQAIIQADCGNEVKEICGTDGIMYRNQCEYQKKRCYLPSLGAQPTTDACASNSGSTATTIPRTTTAGSLTELEIVCKILMHYTCPDETDELCATDNVTYRNDCEYEKAKCTHHDLHVKYFAPCG